MYFVLLLILFCLAEFELLLISQKITSKSYITYTVLIKTSYNPCQLLLKYANEPFLCKLSIKGRVQTSDELYWQTRTSVFVVEQLLYSTLCAIYLSNVFNLQNIFKFIAMILYTLDSFEDINLVSKFVWAEKLARVRVLPVGDHE